MSPELYTPFLHNGVEAVSVGWLGAGLPSTGNIDPVLLEAIQHSCEFHSVNHWLGLHECELCRCHSDGGEWWIDWNKVRFVLPRMVGHYIQIHGYLPPASFLEALLGFWNSKNAELCRQGLCAPIVVSAAERGKVKELEELLERGADATGADQWHRTPLSASARACQPECTELLLERVEYPIATLNEALHAAVISATRMASRQSTPVTIVRHLLKAGAQVGIPDRFGRLPIEIARAGKADVLAEILCEHSKAPRANGGLRIFKNPIAAWFGRK